MLTDQITCNILCEVIVKSGIKDVVISPGSRNTPLIIAFDNAAGVTRHIVIDEREAAFIALGIAQVTQRAVALICTSGTAVLNYAPAIAEAYYQGIPLIAISADRPSCWIDQDDSQTIRQINVLDNFVKGSYHLPYSRTRDDEWYANRIANDAVMNACCDKKGPVHINVEIDVPLSHPAKKALPKQRIIDYIQSKGFLADSVIDRLAEEAENKKILILGGFYRPDDRLNEALSFLTALPNIYVAAETISNIHLNHRSWALDTIFSILRNNEFELLRPDIVITFGGALVSRQIKEFLRKFSPSQHWSVGFDHTTVDCFQSLTKRIEIEPSAFFRDWGRKIIQKKNMEVYSCLWSDFLHKAIRSQERYIDSIPWSDMSAYHTILNTVPIDYNLQLSNGTSIRYAQLLLNRMPHACFCNRGVSGIDGSTATAIGASYSYDRNTLLLTGDMSLAYDIGALSGRMVTPRLKIAVINNSGGGIFRFIPSTRDLEIREEYFCANPDIDIQKISEAFGFRYLYADNAQKLKQELKQLYDNHDRPTILEVKTPPDISADVLTNYFKRK